MINKIKRLIALMGASLLLALGSMSTVAMAAADPLAGTCQGAKLGFSENVADNKKECAFDGNGEGKVQSRVNNLITQIINIFSIIVGIAAVIMIIYGGFRYITSGGDSGAITTAKNTILYAIVGLIIVVFAQLIVKFVLNRLTQS